MKKKLGKVNTIVVLVLIVSAIGLTLWQMRIPTAVVELKGEELNVLVAKSPKHLIRGLGRRDELAPHDGMLFVFPLPRKVGIVMRDMHFPIDIVWFDGSTVVDIAPEVQIEPGRTEEELTIYYPRIEANVVLELPAGWAAQHDLAIGDQITLLQE